MTVSDPRVDRFCEAFFRSAINYSEHYATYRTSTELGSRAVEIIAPSVLQGSMLDPLSGLRPSSVSNAPSDFTIYVFDNAEGARLPIAQWPSEWHFPLGQIAQRRTGRYRVAIDRHTATVSVFDLLAGVCGVWVYEANRLPYWWLATPFRLQFSWIADTFDAELVHAAAVVVGEGAVLFGGQSGSGKSTLAHQLGMSGFQVLSDDFVVVEKNMVSSPYLRTKLHDASIEAFPSLNELVINKTQPGEKRILSGAIARGVKPLELTRNYVVGFGDRADAYPVAQKEVFREFVLGTVPGVLGGSVRSLMRLSRISRAVPARRFQTSPSARATLSTWGNEFE